MLPISIMMFEREKNGLCSKLWNLHIHCTIQWYYRLLTQKGPLPKIGRSYFLFILLYFRDELGHHTKFYQNRVKNKKVTSLFSPLSSRRRFTMKRTMSESHYWVILSCKAMVCLFFFPVLLKYVIIELYAHYCCCLTSFKWFYV